MCSSLFTVALRVFGELSTDVDNFSLFLGRGGTIYFYFLVLAQHPSATVGIGEWGVVSIGGLLGCNRNGYHTCSWDW